jgi:HSP20 family protein
MEKDRDPLANVERMRRELGELFDDVWTRTRLSSRRRPGFRPRVDVYYCGDPPSKAVVKADLSGVRIEDVHLQIQDRTLVMTGQRRPGETGGRVYQQVEIEHGPFERHIQLGIDVDPEQTRATYEDGILQIDLPVARGRGESRRVPISGSSEQSGRKPD